MTFEEVQADYAPLVRAAVRQKVPETDAPDVEAEVWVSVFTALRNFDGRSLVKTFIYPIVKRRIADYYRQRYRDGKLMQEAKARVREAAAASAEAEPQATIMPTATELRVLRLLAYARANDAIAAELGVSKDTVRSHVKALYRKLKLRNRGELCIFAHRFLGGEQ